MSDHISQGAIKILEIIGVSSKNFEDAVHQGVNKAAESVKGITGVEVLKQSAKVKDGKPYQYNAHLKVAFVVK